MKSGSTVEVIVVSRCYDETQSKVVWRGEVPHDSDYPALDKEGAELGRELLEALARQKPWEVIGVMVVDVSKNTPSGS